VYPAAGFIPHVKHRTKPAIVAEINLDPTSNTSVCDMVFSGKAGELLPTLFRMD
jgi:NAD-dependent deacetylase sirtuin 5